MQTVKRSQWHRYITQAVLVPCLASWIGAGSRGGLRNAFRLRTVDQRITRVAKDALQDVCGLGFTATARTPGRLKDEAADIAGRRRAAGPGTAAGASHGSGAVGASGRLWLGRGGRCVLHRWRV